MGRANRSGRGSGKLDFLFDEAERERAAGQLQQTEYLLRSPENAKRLREALAAVEKLTGSTRARGLPKIPEFLLS